MKAAISPDGRYIAHTLSQLGPGIVAGEAGDDAA